MPIFGRKDKNGNPSINMMMVDGIATIYRGAAINLTMLDSELIIKARFGKNAPAILHYNQITNVDYVLEKEIVERSKSVIGRGAVGGILLGPLGAIVGGMSGVGSKSKKVNHFYFVINYNSSSGDELKVISFEIVGATYGLSSFTKKLKEVCGISERLNTPINL